MCAPVRRVEQAVPRVVVARDRFELEIYCVPLLCRRRDHGDILEDLREVQGRVPALIRHCTRRKRTHTGNAHAYPADPYGKCIRVPSGPKREMHTRIATRARGTHSSSAFVPAEPKMSGSKITYLRPGHSTLSGLHMSNGGRPTREIYARIARTHARRSAAAET